MLPIYLFKHRYLQVLSSDTEYHTKNRLRRVERAEREQWEEPLQHDHGALYASAGTSFDWLCNLINRFAVKKGDRCNLLFGKICSFSVLLMLAV